MSGVGITITRDDATPLLQRINDSAQVAGLSVVIARAIGIQVKDHLVALNAERHRYGRNYYAQAARSVTTKGAGGFAIVSITQIGFRLRLYGGTVKAGKNVSSVTGKLTRFLTIPATPEAYGMRAGEFHDLKVGLAMNPRGQLQFALIRRVSQAISIVRRKKKDGSVHTTVRPGVINGGGEVMFWLVRKVTQRADPSVLPEKREMIATGMAAAEKRIMRLAHRQEGNAS